jgi:hypothetical protein
VGPAETFTVPASLYGWGQALTESGFSSNGPKYSRLNMYHPRSRNNLKRDTCLMGAGGRDAASYISTNSYPPLSVVLRVVFWFFVFCFCNLVDFDGLGAISVFVVVALTTGVGLFALLAEFSSHGYSPAQIQSYRRWTSHTEAVFA